MRYRRYARFASAIDYDTIVSETDSQVDILEKIASTD
jgi:hypothetical protein